MRAGTLNQRVAVQEHRYIGQDPMTGEELREWVTVIECWADIQHLSGLETIKNAVPTSTVKASIRVRYRPGIRAAMRIVHGATVYDIEAVLPGQHRYNKHITFVCSTIGNET